jgi:hypothetical protein
MQRPLELLHPERQKALQLGKFWKEIVVLPDVGLQQPAMVRTPIQDVRGRQTITTDLLASGLGEQVVCKPTARTTIRACADHQR